MFTIRKDCIDESYLGGAGGGGGGGGDLFLYPAPTSLRFKVRTQSWTKYASTLSSKLRLPWRGVLGIVDLWMKILGSPKVNHSIVQVVPGRAGGGSFKRKKNYIAKKEFAYRMCARWPTIAMSKLFFWGLNEAFAVSWLWCHALWGDVFVIWLAFKWCG